MNKAINKRLGQTVASNEFERFPYRFDELEPFISEESLRLHHINHQLGHAKKLIQLIECTDFNGLSLIDIVRTSEGLTFYNAAELWNHQFFWKCLRPNSVKQPSQISHNLLQALERSFSSFSSFCHHFEFVAMQQFTSGWIWLIQDACGSLKVIKTSGALTPALDINCRPILALDLWEHAYYLDYAGHKERYLKAYWNRINWDFVNSNFSDADMPLDHKLEHIL